MNIRHMRRLANTRILLAITILYLFNFVKGSNVKNNAWSNGYNQQIYSDLTGTIRELTSMDNGDDTDTRFQPPLDTNKNKVHPIAEGYRLASTELIAPALSVSLNQESRKDRLKRDASLDNSSTSRLSSQTTTTATTTSSSSTVNIEQLTARLTNNRSDVDDDLILNDANANAWAVGLLSATLDGSGDTTEATTETESMTTIYLTSTEQSTLITLTSTETSSASTTITSLETTVTEQTSFETETTTGSQSSTTEQTEEVSTSEESSTSGSTETTTEPFQAETQFYLYYAYTARTLSATAPTNPPTTTSVRTQTADILLNRVTLNSTPRIVVNDISSPPINYDFEVLLDVPLNTTQKILLVNGFIDYNANSTDGACLTVGIPMTTNTADLSNFTSDIQTCEECEFNNRGNCNNDTITCTCYYGYGGNVCQDIVQTTAYSSTSITEIESTTEITEEPSSESSSTVGTSTVTSITASETSVTEITAGTSSSSIETETSSVSTVTQSGSSPTESVTQITEVTSNVETETTTGATTATSETVTEITEVTSAASSPSTEAETETISVTTSFVTQTATEITSTIETETVTEATSIISTAQSETSAETVTVTTPSETVTEITEVTSTIGTETVTTATLITSTAQSETSAETSTEITQASSTVETETVTTATPIISTAQSETSTETVTATTPSETISEATATEISVETATTSITASTESGTESVTAATSTETMTEITSSTVETETITSTATISAATSTAQTETSAETVTASARTSTESITETVTVITSTETATELSSTIETETVPATTSITSTAQTETATEITSSTVGTETITTATAITSTPQTETSAETVTEITELTSASTLSTVETETITAATSVTSTIQTETSAETATELSSTIETETVTAATSITSTAQTETSAETVTASAQTITESVTETVTATTSTETATEITQASSSVETETVTAGTSITSTIQTETSAETVTEVSSTLETETITASASIASTTKIETSSETATASIATSTESETETITVITPTVTQAETFSESPSGTTEVTATSITSTAQTETSTEIVTPSITASTESETETETITVITPSVTQTASLSTETATQVTEATSTFETETVTEATSITPTAQTETSAQTVTATTPSETVTEITQASSSVETETVTTATPITSTAQSETSAETSTEITQASSTVETETVTTATPIISTAQSETSTETVTVTIPTETTTEITAVTSTIGTETVTTATSMTSAETETVTEITEETSTAPSTSVTQSETVTATVTGITETPSGTLSSTVETETAPVTSSTPESESVSTASVTEVTEQTSTSGTSSEGATGSSTSATEITEQTTLVTATASSATETEVTAETSSTVSTSIGTATEITEQTSVTPASSTIESTSVSTESEAPTSEASVGSTTPISTSLSTSGETTVTEGTSQSTSEEASTTVVSETVPTSVSGSTGIVSTSTSTAVTSSETETTTTTGSSSTTTVSSVSEEATSESTASVTVTVTSSSTEQTSTVTTTESTEQTSTIITTESTTSTSTTASTTSTSTTASTTVTTAITRNCIWTDWIQNGNCTPSCGEAYRFEIRACFDTFTSQSCSSSECGGGSATRNQSCTASPPCEILTVSPNATSRDPRIKAFTYQTPDPMFFAGENFRSFTITDKGYISLRTIYYGQTMTSTQFQNLNNQAIIAPLWANLTYQSGQSSVVINWFSSLNSSQGDASSYIPIVQQTINDVCPATTCSSNPTVVRVLRIQWNNVTYKPLNSNLSTPISFAAYLINTYDISSYGYSYPFLRSYLRFDYTSIPRYLTNLIPLIGYRGRTAPVSVFNDPANGQNALFLKQRTDKSLYVGGRFLTQCEVNFLTETSYFNSFPYNNLNDEINNPRFPCPCTFRQAQSDRRFIRLWSETYYEIQNNVACFSPITTFWTRVGWIFRPLRPQTCCYNTQYQSLITSGSFAGSVLEDIYALFQSYTSYRRIPFHDHCCLPIGSADQPDWNVCRLYYQLHPASTCIGYQPPAIVTGVGDPHINTIDNGRYTCHIRGTYIFAQTTANANQLAYQNNATGNLTGDSFIFPSDLFTIQVRSEELSPAMYYVERTQGKASVFTSYVIIAANNTFNISKNGDKFGFTVLDSSNNLTNLSTSLGNNLNYDFISSTNTADQYVYRIQQTTNQLTNPNITLSKLIVSIWSGLTIECVINGENLECLLSLPQKYRSHIEGLIGNFDGNSYNDLINRYTNQTVWIPPATNNTASFNDSVVLSACLSWRVSTDRSANITMPILPSTLVNWYQTNGSSILSALNPALSQSQMNGICSNNFECQHDYIIRVNRIASAATASAIQSFQQDTIAFAEKPATAITNSPIKIFLAYNNPNRAYSINATVTGATSTIVMENRNGTTTNTTFNGQNINVAIPSNVNSYVDISLLTVSNQNLTTQYPITLIVCLCADESYCNDYTDVTTMTQTYQIVSCDCPPQYDGTYCESQYNGCLVPNTCTENWVNGTQCISLSAAEQINQTKAFVCNGSCVSGYQIIDGYMCEDIDECENATICGNFSCTNTEGSYICGCPTGYRFANGNCTDINECDERYVDGEYTAHCNGTSTCVNDIGSFHCTCSPSFNNGTCIYDESLCQGDKCIDSLNNTACLHGSFFNGTQCVPWCESSCPGFCQLVNDYYQCNCSTIPGFQLAKFGRECHQCGPLNYGFGCEEDCNCTYGTCNPNATTAEDSCTCPGYHTPTCTKLIDLCSQGNTSCSNSTTECYVDEVTLSLTCSCKAGYERTNASSSCIDIDECARNTDRCDDSTSICNNTIGDYNCICRSGYQLITDTKLCSDINECAVNASSCSGYPNTYCTNTLGSFECRCNPGYSLGGDYSQEFGDARANNASCSPTDYSALCVNSCSRPALCSSTTGRCQCPNSSYALVNDPNNNTLQTCNCPNHPFSYYNGSDCVDIANGTWFLLNYSPETRSRLISIPSNTTNLDEEISKVLFDNLNITCNGTCIKLYNTSSVDDLPNIQIMVTLNTNLDVTGKIQLINALLRGGAPLSGYTLDSVEIIVDPKFPRETFSEIQPDCVECHYLQTGACNLNNTACNCFTDYTGYLCRTYSPPTLATPNIERNWTVIVAVVSAIAGLLLIIALAMCLFYVITKCRQSGSSSSKSQGNVVTRQQFTIPRAHMPAMGTGARAFDAWDGFSLDNTYDEQYLDASDTLASSASTTYNTTYRTNGQRAEADFGIFDDLEKRTPMSKGHIPRPQMVDMLGTLNSLPTNDQFDNISTGSMFNDSRDINEIELVTDMLEDMTRDDDLSDEFVEALNPNIAIPRLNIESQARSNGWFSFFRNS